MQQQSPLAAPSKFKRPNGKTPSTPHAEGLRTIQITSRDSTQTAEAAQQQTEKAVTTQIAELALKGHAVHQLVVGGFVVCKYGMAKYCDSFTDLQAFAEKLGVSQ